MKSQKFKLNIHQMHLLEITFNTLHLDFENNTLIVTDAELEDLLTNLNHDDEKHVEIINELVKQDTHNIIKEYQTNGIQLPII